MSTQATNSSPQDGTQPAGSCGECGAPHAEDQRYCLACGAPLASSDTTVAFAPLLNGGERPSPPASPPAHLLAVGTQGGPLPQHPQGDGHGAGSAPTVIAGVGVLLLAMGVGVLIGRTGASSSPATATSPQVVTVTASTSSTETTESASGSGSGSSKHHPKSAGSSKEVGSSIEKPAPPSVLSKLKESEKSGNGSKYEQESNHLPNVVSTG